MIASSDICNRKWAYECVPSKRMALDMFDAAELFTFRQFLIVFYFA